MNIVYMSVSNLLPKISTTQNYHHFRLCVGYVTKNHGRERKSSNKGLIRKQINADCHAEQICRAHL